MAAEDAGDAHPASRQLFENESKRDQVGSHASVGLGDGETEEAHLLHALDDLGRIPPFVLEVTGNRSDVSAHEVPEHGSEHDLFVAEVEVHRRWTPIATVRTNRRSSPAPRCD